jgi:hypothetical protein
MNVLCYSLRPKILFAYHSINPFYKTPLPLVNLLSPGPQIQSHGSCSLRTPSSLLRPPSQWADSQPSAAVRRCSHSSSIPWRRGSPRTSPRSKSSRSQADRTGLDRPGVSPARALLPPPGAPGASSRQVLPPAKSCSRHTLPPATGYSRQVLLN